MGIKQMINRYCKQQKQPYDILLSEEFQQSRDYLKAKKKHLRKLGLGNKPTIAEEVDFSDEEALIERGAMSAGNTEGLVTLVWYLNTLNFGLRSTHEHRQLKWDDIKLINLNGKETLGYSKRQTKSRDGSNSKQTRAYASKSWKIEQDQRKCHISANKQVINNADQIYQITKQS